MDCGWEYPTLIQERALDALLGVVVEDTTTITTTTTSAHGGTPTCAIPNSMVIQAQTGSGKTLTYLLPVLAQIQPTRNSIQAMIVVPTRELGLQVAQVAKQLASGYYSHDDDGRTDRILIMSLLQGSTLKRQRAWAWAETPQIVIGTPTELLNMVQYGGLPRIHSIRHVVVDEVDACLVSSSSSSSSNKQNNELASSLHILLSQFLSPTYALDNGIENDMEGLPTLDGGRKGRSRRSLTSRQTIFASATIPQHRHFLKQCVQNQWTCELPEFVCTSPGEALPPTLQHAYTVCTSQANKVAALRKVLKKVLGQTNKPRKILIFCEVSRPLLEMAQIIAHDTQSTIYQEHATFNATQSIVSILRKEDSLSQRAGATQAFANLESPCTILLTGDLAARGLDVLGVTHVIHFDLPSSADVYLHRSGRAGRLGRSGQVISLITESQEFVLQRLANALQIPQEDLKCIGRQRKSHKSISSSSSPAATVNED